MPVKLRNTRGKNFGAPELSGPNPAQKRARADLLSSNPGLFNGNRSFGPLKINDVAKSAGVSGLLGSVKTSKFKRSK